MCRPDRDASVALGMRLDELGRRGSDETSPPDADLSVFPIVPPIDPDWASTMRSVPTQAIKQLMPTMPKVTGLHI